MAGDTHARGGRDTELPKLRGPLAIALLLHLPVVPWIRLLPFLGALFTDAPSDWDYKDDQVIVPIELDEAPPEVAAPETAPMAAPPDRPDEGLDGAKRRDAGVADAKPEAAPPDARDDAADARAIADAKTDAERAAPPAPRRDAGIEASTVAVAVDAGAGEAGTASVKDSLGLTGALAKTVPGKPNVVLVFWFAAMREHPLGRQVGELLGCQPQWKDFLGGEVDPVRDLDGIMMAGPRMADSSKLTVAVQERMSDDKVRSVVGALVARSEDAGAWLDAGAGGLVARAHADRADRIVFTHARDMIFITPPEGYEQVRAVRQPLSLPPGRGRAMSLTLVHPWRPLRAVKVNAPDTVTELRLDVVATEDGGVNLALELDDRDADAAAADAKVMTEELARSPIAMLVGDARFEPSGSRFAAKTHLSRLETGLFLSFVRGVSCPKPPEDAGATR